MAADAILDFDRIENAEARTDGVFELPLLPLSAQVLFPRVLSLVALSTEAQVKAAAFAREQSTTLIACKIRVQAADHALKDTIHAIGTEIAPGKTSEITNDSVQLLAQGRRRVRILEVRQRGAYPIATACAMDEEAVEPQALESLATAIKELFKHSSQ